MARTLTLGGLMWGHSRKLPKAPTWAGKAGFLGKQRENIETKGGCKAAQMTGTYSSLSIKSPEVTPKYRLLPLKKNKTRGNTRLKRHLKTWGQILGFWGVK
jgi:hypothetical protein